MHCPKCENEIDDAVKFCWKCGNDLVIEEKKSIKVRTRWPRKIAAGIIFLFLMAFVLFVIDEGSKSWG